MIPHPASQGKRERLHGHNYRVEVTVEGREGVEVAEDGYLLDFGEVKMALKRLCAELDERFLCPAYCDALDVCEVKPGCPSTAPSLGGPGEDAAAAAELRIVVKADGARFV